MQRYCPRCEKNETRDACKYGPKYWDMFSTPISLSSNAYDPNKPHPANEEKDHEYSMARSEISTIISAAKRLRNKMGKGEGSLEAWVQSKITKAADYLDSAADYVDSGEMKAEGLSFDIGSRHKEVRTTNASRKLQQMTTAQQAQLPKEKVKKVIKKEIKVKVEEIRVEKKEKKIKAKIEEENKPKVILKVGDRVRMNDGKAVGTIDKIEKKKATVNYGIFTSKVNLEELEYVQPK